MIVLLTSVNCKFMENKRTCVAHVESNGNGYYSVYCEEQFPFGFFGEGYSIEEAKQDFIAVFEAFCADHLKRTGEVVEATFTFVLDESAR